MRRTARALSVAVLAGVALGGPTAVVRADPDTDPGVNPAASTARHPDTDSDADRAASTGLDRGTDPDADLAASTGLDRGTDPDADPAASAGLDQDTDPAASTARDQDTDPDADPAASTPPDQGTDRGAHPAAEVSPATVHPGGSVTVSVSCGPVKEPAPKTIEATSDAFVDGVAELRRVPGEDHGAGPAYRGSARIAPAADLDAGAGPDSEWTVDGTCPAPRGTEGEPWSAAFTVTPGGGTPTAPPGGQHPCPPERADSCGDAVIPGGVRAGQGGTFTDSVPVLAVGGVCFAAALGGAAYRLRRKRPVTEA
ncbi:hypothetical protein ABZ354_00330 [Streptomyces sp. NPDC005925]|uniref:hypothetical protein n=1 Tax=Streptomyces sp. NPDC005925 TaxID=3157172 RepID=UPI0033E5596A